MWMLTGKEMLGILKANKELAFGFYDKDNGFCLKVKPNVKLNKKKLKRSSEFHHLTESEERYLEMLKLNPRKVHLEYSIMGYFIITSKIPMNKLKLIPGMEYKPSLGIYDENISLNISR